MKYTAQAVIQAPVEAIDLETWLFTLSDAEYQAAARGHRAAGTFVQDGRRGTVNVETVGGTLLIQHYLEQQAGPTHVDMLSERSRGYLFHLVPVPVWVRWTLTAEPRDHATATFTCTVEVDLPLLLRPAAALVGTPLFLRRHVHEETRLFAADIERKLAGARVS